MDKRGEIAGGFHKLITFDIDTGARKDDVQKRLCWVTFETTA